MSTAPRFDIDVDAFWRDPYPALAQMRAEAPIVFVPQLGATLLTRRDDIASMEKRVDVLSSDQPGGLMNRLMGQNMMRKDGAAHTAERNVYSPAIAPAAVAAHWRAQFQRHADHILDGLAGQGRGDLIDAFALPLSAECLKSMTGLTNVRYQDMDAWSQAMIQGIANYDGDPEVERRCNEATAAIDAAIDDVLPVVRRAPDHSLLSVMLEGGLSEAQARANVKLTISGGQNEPRKAIAGTIWALLTHPARGRASSKAPAPRPTRTRPADVRITVTAVGTYDPEGDRSENDGDAGLATDGNRATAWKSEHYRRAFVKSGVGLVVDAGRPVSAKSVVVITDSPGYTAQVRAGASATGPFVAVSGTKVTTRRERRSIPGRARDGRYLMLWIMSMPETGNRPP